MERNHFVDMTQADTADATVGRGTSRRRVIGAGLVGAAALAIGARDASARSTKVGSTPPQHPTEADDAVLAFAQQVELGARDFYRNADTSGLSEAAVAAFDAFAHHHGAYAQAISALIGVKATNEPLSSFLADVGSDADDVVLVAHDVENALVATHTAVLGALEGINGAEVIASMMIVEARHAAAIAALAGLDPAADTDAFLVTPTSSPVLAPAGA